MRALSKYRSAHITIHPTTHGFYWALVARSVDGDRSAVRRLEWGVCRDFPVVTEADLLCAIAHAYDRLAGPPESAAAGGSAPPRGPRGVVPR